METNSHDLAWHAVEFDHKRSFAWIFRDGQGGYLGCLYVFPRFMEQAADVFVWARSGADPVLHEAAVVQHAAEWLAGPDWPDLAYHFHQPG